MKTSTGLALALAVACAGAGCISEANYCATWIHQSLTTNKAWRNRKWMYEGIACESSFKAGFKAGYRFASCGGDSCQPPGTSHFWSAGGITEEDQRESQAWCDGFTHGALAAQQDGNATVSALDEQTAQPPAGVPEVYYYSGLGASGSIGSPQGMGQFGQGQFAPGGYPAGQYSPGPFPPESFSVGTAPFESGTMSSAQPWAANRSTETAPADVAHPPAAPPSESMDRPNGNVPSPSPRYHGSAAFSGVGSLRAMVGPSSSVARLPDHGSAAAVPPAPAPASAHKASPYVANSPIAVSPKGTSEAVPSTLPTPSIQSAPAPQWELPIIRD
ncbi:MAG TPA: hypothetical protein VG055_33940 [Planctomycetaceae bacterium]|jgi:hypothetical protein|nr:hypothetical protein [Planctomycetaceae bacterium]